jgi:hypothetical protein
MPHRVPLSALFRRMEVRELIVSLVDPGGFAGLKR